MARGRGGRGRGRGGRGRGGGDDELDYRPPTGGQPATAGMLPPSDSEEDSDASGSEEEQAEVPKVVMIQNPNAGKMPTDSEEESEEESSSESEEEPPPRPMAPAAPRRKKGEEELDPEQMRIDMERLALIRQKREEDRLKRIAEEGFDRYAPPGDANGRTLPKDHPSVQGKQ